jgi:carbonic anhydrase
MLTFKDSDLRAQLHQKTGIVAAEPKHFHAFSDVHENVRRQVDRVQSHPWIPTHIPVRGFVYDVKTGRLHEVEKPASRIAG